MRLLLDCSTLHSGGGVQVAIAFLDSLLHEQYHKDLRLEWQAVAPEGMRLMLPVGMSDDPRIVFLPKRSKVDLAAAAMRLHGMARQFSPDVVFTVFGPAYFKGRVPHVVGFALPNLIYPLDGPLRAAGGLLYRVKLLLIRQLVRRADHHVVETETVRRRLSKHLNVAASRISVIPNGVNPLLERQPATPVPRAGIFGILVPAAYCRHKNLELLPDVARALDEMTPDIDFEFRLTLDPASAPFSAIMQDARARGVRARIRTLGVLTLSQLAEAYREASAVMLPTLREASTAVYPESFHFDRPLVTSDMDFARELCADAALFCKPLQAEDYARALALLIADRQKGDISGKLVSAGRRRLATAYPSPTEKFQMTIELLQRIAADAGRARRVR